MSFPPRPPFAGAPFPHSPAEDARFVNFCGCCCGGIVGLWAALKIEEEAEKMEKESKVKAMSLRVAAGTVGMATATAAISYGISQGALVVSFITGFLATGGLVVAGGAILGIGISLWGKPRWLHLSND